MRSGDFEFRTSGLWVMCVGFSGTMVLALGLVVSAVLFAFPSLALGAWNQPVAGSDPVNQSPSFDGGSASLAESGGVPHVAWTEDDAGGSREVRVARLSATGTGWEQPWSGVSAGSGGINQATDVFASQPSLVDVDGSPFVAWTENDADSSDEIRVASLDANSWTQPWSGVSPGSGGIHQDSNASAGQPSLAEGLGSVWVAWREFDGSNFEIRVAENSNSITWQQPWTGVDAGSGAVNQSTTRSGSEPSLAVIGGRIYVAWTESDGTNQELRVARLNLAGTDWEQPWDDVSATSGGINRDTARNASAPSLVEIEDVPYVAWSEPQGSDPDIRVSSLNPTGTAWEPVGGALNIAGNGGDSEAREPSIVEVGGRPFVAWAEEIESADPEIFSARLGTDGSTWEYVG